MSPGESSAEFVVWSAHPLIFGLVTPINELTLFLVGESIWIFRLTPSLNMANDFSTPGSGQPFGLSVNPAPGVRVGGARYILKRVLGRGDGTVVWLARDVKLEAEVALKVLPEFLVRDPNTIERLKTEIGRLAKVNHPNIARTLDLVRDHSLTAISSDYVEGWSLAALRVDKPEKRYSLTEITPWIRQVCAALDYVHNEAQAVHGNLKTSNLMLDQRAQIKVMDFGIDPFLRSLGGQADVSRIAATVGFLSPQQALGEKASVLDDVYGLGATIYDLLTGTPPFYKGQVLAQVCERKAQTMAERLAELGITDSVSLVVEDTVGMCLEKEAAKRPPNIPAVLQLLERSEVPTRVAPVEDKKEERKETADAEGHPEYNRHEAQSAAEEEPGPVISEPEPDPSSMLVLESAQTQTAEASPSTNPEAVLDPATGAEEFRAPSPANL